MTASDGLLATVRSSCSAIASQARLVTINHGALADYASAIPIEEAKQAAAADRLTETATLPVDHERTIALTLSSVAVNFTSGWHDIMPKRPGMSGAVSTVARLVDYEREVGGLTPTLLHSFSDETAGRVFELADAGEPALDELAGLLAKTLTELGSLAADHGGFEALVDAADQSAERLAGLLGTLPSFADTASHHGAPVAFYKRAQMAAASLHREFAGSGPGTFTDLDQLTIFADNLVPHVLRLDGLLAFDADLERRIETGSCSWLAARAKSRSEPPVVHSVELLLAEIRNQGKTITAADVDHWLWTRGGEPAYKARRRHRCRNPYY